MKLKVITPTSKSSSIEVSKVIFGQQANPNLLAQAVRVYLSNLRQGTAKVKTRSNVNRTHAKWYRQKGTGNARHGSRNAPIFVGGGVAHGPTGLENWERQLNRKMKAQALRVALSMQAEKIVVTDNLNGLKGKTKEAAKLLKKMLGETGRIVIVLGENTALMRQGLRNIDRVLPMSVSQLTALQVALADTIVLTKDSLKDLETRLAAKKKVITQPKVEPSVAKKTVVKPTKKTVVKPTKKAAARSKKPAVKKVRKTTKKK